MVTNQELGSQGFSITAISFNAAPGSDASGPYENVSILMGFTDLNALTETFDSNWRTSGSLVYTSPLKQLSGISSGQWFTFQLDEPFDYDGSSNLLVELEWNGPEEPPIGEGSIYTWIWSTSANRSVTSNEAGSPTGYAAPYCHYLALDYQPLSLDQTTFAGIKASF